MDNNKISNIKMHSIPTTVTVGNESFNVGMFAIDLHGNVWGLQIRKPEEIAKNDYDALVKKLKSEGIIDED